MITSSRTAAVAAALLLLGGCGGDKITDSGSPEAQACKTALSDGVAKAADAAEAAGQGGSATALTNLLPKENPAECKDIDQSLGTQLATEVATEFMQKQRG